VRWYLTPMLHTLLDGMGRSWKGSLDLIVDVVDVDDRDGFVWKEIVGSFVAHTGGKIAHNWLCSNMKVAHHCIVVPSSHHSNVVNIHVAIYKCHGPSHWKGSGTDLRCVNGGVMHIEAHGVMQHIHNVLGLDKSPSCSPIVIC
jgi:hypothetical protein